MQRFHRFVALIAVTAFVVPSVGTAPRCVSPAGHHDETVVTSVSTTPVEAHGAASEHCGECVEQGSSRSPEPSSGCDHAAAACASMHSCSGGNAAAVARGLFMTPPDIAMPHFATAQQPLGEAVSPEPPPPRA